MSQADPFAAHYADRWCMARTYLTTAASKALVLWDAGVGQSLGQAGLEEEAEVASEMRRDALLRDFHHRLTSAEGISCVKRARNGTLRRISLRLKLCASVDVIVWRSLILRRQRRFPLLTVAAKIHFWVPDAVTPVKGDVLDASFPYQPSNSKVIRRQPDNLPSSALVPLSSSILLPDPHHSLDTPSPRPPPPHRFLCRP